LIPYQELPQKKIKLTPRQESH